MEFGSDSLRSWSFFFLLCSVDQTAQWGSRRYVASGSASAEHAAPGADRIQWSSVRIHTGTRAAARRFVRCRAGTDVRGGWRFGVREIDNSTAHLPILRRAGAFCVIAILTLRHILSLESCSSYKRIWLSGGWRVGIGESRPFYGSSTDSTTCRCSANANLRSLLTLKVPCCYSVSAIDKCSCTYASFDSEFRRLGYRNLGSRIT